MSKGIKDPEPDLFGEPGVFLIRPDATVYMAVVNSMTAARPRIADVLGAARFFTQNSYPARGEARPLKPSSQLRLDRTVALLETWRLPYVPMSMKSQSGTSRTIESLTRRSTMSKDRNVAAQQAFGEAVNAGNLDAFDALVAPDAVDHDPAPGQAPGPNGYKSFFGEMRTAFPDLHVEVEHLVADDESVAFAYTLSGTHNGPFQGHEPTGKKVSVRGVQISKFDEAGMLVERWGSTDEMTMMTQLGIDPS